MMQKGARISAEVAAELAENVREKLGADYGLSVTGVAGPESDGVHIVGTVFAALIIALFVFLLIRKNPYYEKGD